MKRKKFWITVSFLLLCCFSGLTTAEDRLIFDHRLKVTVNPESSELHVVDELRQSGGGKVLQFALSSGFEVRVDGEVAKANRRDRGLSYYKVTLSSPSQTVKIEYHGSIQSTDGCDWLKQSCRLLNERGVYLDTGSFWYPLKMGVMHRFEMDVDVPRGWVTLSQGTSDAENHWSESHPQDDIYLVAGSFHVYTKQHNGRDAMVYLLKEDKRLADTYLNATHRYLDFYSDLIGEYPYSKFVTVESFWETGWGMPSFTLLGSRVIRLPFIPHTSLPHEILHNWWGNSVYIDYSSGNWAEGLTAYLADHRMRELRGSDKGYRRDALQKYGLFTQGKRDFPLMDFRSRHDNTTQAVGYSKVLMLFHQLRKRLGDDVFFAGVKRFYADNRFQIAGYEELKKSFEAEAGVELDGYFQQWLYRTGAPRLKIESVSNVNKELKLALRQLQSDNVFDIDIPVFVEYESGGMTSQLVSMSKRQQVFKIPVEEDVSRVVVDPEFDVIRLLDSDEIPPTLNSRFAQGKVSIVYEDRSLKGTLSSLVSGLSASGGKVQETHSFGKLPAKGTMIWINPSHQVLAGLESLKDQFTVDGRDLLIQGQSFGQDEVSSAVAVRLNQLNLIILNAPDKASLKTLLRKMRHYGKYSYIVFDRSSGRNVLKGQWEVKNSPMIWRAEGGA